MRRIILFLALILTMGACKKNNYSWEADLEHRLECDFKRSADEVKEYIRQYLPDVTDEQMAQWEAARALEAMTLHGEKKYFKNAGPNLFRIDKACRERKEALEPQGLKVEEQVDQVDLPQIMANADENHFGEPKRMRVTYTLTVDADAVPAGEKIRCWLPFPRRDMTRQTDVRLLDTKPGHPQLAPADCEHSTLYMEQRAEQGKPTIFQETFEFTARGAWYNLKEEDIQPYDTAAELYKEYTREREKHVIFTEALRRTADSLTAGETHPLRKAKRLFEWIDKTFPWASAREYSTIDNIPQYVMDNGHGDCGQVTLLFVTMCRYCGIPARFESGFMMHPGAWNMHDWCEIFLEGVGWVPVDQSFGIPRFAENEDERWFFLGGIDSWRMVVNKDFGRPLVPAKRYPRSETVDFQRGEVEWENGNLYFDQWHWDMEITYLTK